MLHCNSQDVATAVHLQLANEIQQQTRFRAHALVFPLPPVLSVQAAQPCEQVRQSCCSRCGRYLSLLKRKETRLCIAEQSACHTSGPDVGLEATTERTR